MSYQLSAVSSAGCRMRIETTDRGSLLLAAESCQRELRADGHITGTARRARQLHGSDLHLTTNTPPQVRVHGTLQTLDLPVAGPAETKALAYSVLTDAQKKRFEESLELDFSFGIQRLARFRCNVFNQRGAAAAVYRVIPETIRSFAELGLPPVLATCRNVHAGWCS